MIDDVSYMRLAAQTALRTHVTADLRAVCVKEEQQTIVATFFCQDELSEELEDSAQVMTSELQCSMFFIRDHFTLMSDTQFILGSHLKPMALFEELVYLRYEPGCESYRNQFPRKIFLTLDSPNLRLAGQQALLGRVTANLRRATIYEAETTVFVHFWYDKAISALEYQLAKEVAQDMQTAFQLNETKVFQCKVEKLAFPHRVGTDFNDIFKRYEPSLPEDFL